MRETPRREPTKRAAAIAAYAVMHPARDLKHPRAASDWNRRAGAELDQTTCARLPAQDRWCFGPHAETHQHGGPEYRPGAADHM